MAKQWRCAVVGCGVVGEWHIRVIPKVPNAALVAVCDPLVEKATAALEKNNLQHVPVYASQEEMQAKEEIDVIHLCTPSGDHLDPAIMAIEAGKNVICEKPMEIQLDRIDRIIAAAKKNNVRLAGIFHATPRLALAFLWPASRDEAMIVEHLVNIGRRDALELTLHFLLERREIVGSERGRGLKFFRSDIISQRNEKLACCGTLAKSRG